MNIGYVGYKAKKKRRLLKSIFFICFITIIIFLYYNSFEKETQIILESKNADSLAVIESIERINSLELNIIEKDQKLVLRENIIDNLRNDINKLKDQNAKLNELTNLLEKKNINNNESSKKNYDIEKNKLSKEIENYLLEIKKLKNDFILLNNDLNIMKSNKKNAENENKKLLDQISKLKRIIVENEKKISKLEDISHH